MSERAMRGFKRHATVSLYSKLTDKARLKSRGWRFGFSAGNGIRVPFSRLSSSRRCRFDRQVQTANPRRPVHESNDASSTMRETPRYSGFAPCSANRTRATGWRSRSIVPHSRIRICISAGSGVLRAIQRYSSDAHRSVQCASINKWGGAC